MGAVQTALDDRYREARRPAGFVVCSNRWLIAMADHSTSGQSRWTIPFALCVAVLGVSSSAPLVKLAAAPAPAVAAYRMLFSALLLFEYLVLRGSRKGEINKTRHRVLL